MAKSYLSKESFTYFVTLLTNHLKVLVKKSDIVNNLEDTSSNKPLSAAQGKALKDLIEKVPASDSLMQKSTYDPDGDGEVDKAALADKATNADNATNADSAKKADDSDKLGGYDASEYLRLEEGQIASKYLPSYVDDVIEGYYHNGQFYNDADHEDPINGEKGKIYVDISSEGGSISYRYSGSAYVQIVSSDMVEITTQEVNDIWSAATTV